jgi:hypothetical protein
MVYDAQDYWFFGLCLSFGIQKTQKNTTFLKLDLFLEGQSFMLLGYLTMDKVQNPAILKDVENS